MRILAIDTSCDETAAAVTSGTEVLTNIIWSQASQHAAFGGVMPSVAQRMHEERIDFVINKAIKNSQIPEAQVEAVAVTAGPGLAIALGVGIQRARKMATRLSVPLIPINHIEGHLLSPLAKPHVSTRDSGRNQEVKEEIHFPAFGLVISGGHTELVLIKKIGDYQILAKTQDDALGEALDKAARMLGLGYPGGAILEKMARKGNSKEYQLPLPMARSLDKKAFSYSGLKTAFWRLTQQNNSSDLGWSRDQIYNLAASFQNRAFEHLIRVVRSTISDSPERSQIREMLVGGGVSANIELRRRLRKLARELNLKVRFPYSTKLTGDNAAMIGIAADLNSKNTEIQYFNYDHVDRLPRWSTEETYNSRLAQSTRQA